MFERMLAASIVVSVVVLAPAAVVGQTDEDARWTPKRYSQTELIDFGTRSESPLVFPWSVVRIEQVTNYGRLDFKHVLEADHREVNEYLEEKFDEQAPALELNQAAVSAGKSRELHVLGKATKANSRNFTLGNSDLREDFLIQLKEEEGRAVIVFKNMAKMQVFGAGVPKLSPFKPVDAEPIPLNR